MYTATGASTQSLKSFCVTPRIVKIEVCPPMLPPRYTPGVMRARSVLPWKPNARIWSPVNALIEMPTSWIDCSRFCAVTMISSRHVAALLGRCRAAEATEHRLADCIAPRRCEKSKIPSIGPGSIDRVVHRTPLRLPNVDHRLGAGSAAPTDFILKRIKAIAESQQVQQRFWPDGPKGTGADVSVLQQPADRPADTAAPAAGRNRRRRHNRPRIGYYFKSASPASNS